MLSLSVLVLGGGAAGLSAALALARDGHHVTLFERDPMTAEGPLDAFGWVRAGIPHFLQPHAFVSRGRAEMRAHFPDVFAALLDAGAEDQDLRTRIHGPLRPEDEALAFLAARRPLIEWALRRAVLAEPTVRVLSGVNVTGLLGDWAATPRITGAQTSVGPVHADLVVDAMGRRTAVPTWLKALGGRPMAVQSTDCGIIYYSRYYRIRDGATLPDGQWILSPRGDLGYGAFATFRGDNRTFAALIAIPTGDQALKALRHSAAFEAAGATFPALHAWTDPDLVEPITDVLPMGSLQNTLRTPDAGRMPAIGIISVTDAVCHTDPVIALGLSFALIHALALSAAIRDQGADIEGVGAAFDAAIRPEMTERFELAGAIDNARSRAWAGEDVDFAHHDGGDYPYFAFVAGSAVALVDDDVFRTVVRRNMFLDRLSVLDEDLVLQRRIEHVFAELAGRPRPPAGPPRAELLRIIGAALDA